MDAQKIFSPPRMRGNTNIERKATWTELFYDLAFVVAIAVVGHELSAHFDLKGVAVFLVVFGMFWWAWIGNTFYNDRFDTDDLIHRLLTLAQMIAIASAAIFAHDILGTNFVPFILSYGAIRLLIIFSNGRAGYYNKKARFTMIWYVIGSLIALIPLVFALFQESMMTRLVLMYLSLSIDMLLPIFALPSDPEQQSLNVTHLSERFGLFTILILGETIASVVGAGSEIFTGIPSFITIAFGILLAFVFWWIYFENLDGDAIKKGKATGIVWVYTHLPLMAGLVLLALGIERVIMGIPNEAVSDLFSHAALINYAWAFVFFCFSIIEFVTTYKGQKRWYEISEGGAFILAGCISLALIFVGLHNRPVINMAILSFIGLVLVIIDLGFKFRCQSCLNKAE